LLRQSSKEDVSDVGNVSSRGDTPGLSADCSNKKNEEITTVVAIAARKLDGLCRNHAFDRFSQSFLEAYNTMDIEGIQVC
jgi:hypothetical protein